MNYQHQVDTLVSKFNQLLLKESYENYYHIVIEGEYDRVILKRVEEAFKTAGWNNVICRTSSEKGERPGLTSLQILQ